MRNLQLVILTAALLFAAGGFWLWQRNSTSKEDLKLELLAPDKAVMGQEITYTVKWKNNGDVALENAIVIFEYPESSLPSQGTLLRATKQLDDIYPGQEDSLAFKTRLFGAQGDFKEAKAMLSYKPRNLNARYEAETSATTTISLVPLNFDLDLPSRIESGQQFTFALNYFSNSDYPLSDLKIEIEYPQGFEFGQAIPASLGDNEWRVPLLNKTQGGRVSVKGTLVGELQELKTIRATIGTWKDGKFTLLKEIVKGVEITKPEIRISQLVNGKETSAVSSGDTLHYEIFFRNVSERDLENLFLIVGLEGKSIDVSTLRTENGKFQKGDNSVVWEARDVAKLRLLGQGEEGKVEFWVDVQSVQGKNLVVRDKVLLSEARAEFEVKVNSNLLIHQAAYFQDEVFGNTGHLPPTVGNKTTYTVIWKAENSSNEVKNAKVRATLPQGVELTGSLFPENVSLTFDSQSREIVWSAGDLVAGAGLSSPAVSVAFQIALTPNDSQRGTPPQILGEAHIAGDDAWTLQSLSSSDIPLDTTLPDDPASQGKGVVQ